ncbi:hypothetical protein PsYK624_011280 [Phanerochaete sordida]|uniref:DUF6533 domain-containing protein n=1 Tax=Phanerochaete sordida TaxID=48140 RepID=A0A9P3FYT2_9APHY|nr:hypothetical protein PsYK624_011280 [Phanerochaete sordida]
MSNGAAQAAFVFLVEEKLKELRLANCCATAACCLLLYDYLLTLSTEVRCVWRKRLNGASLLFYVNRYGAISLRVVLLAQGTIDFGPLSDAFSDRALSVVIQLDIAAITALRIYAIWSPHRAIAALSILVVGAIPAVISIVINLRDTFPALPPPFTGCGTITGLSDSSTTAAMIVRDGERIVRVIAFGIPPLITATGSICFISLLALNIANVFAIRSQDIGSIRVLNEALSSIFVSHLILNLRSMTASGGSKGDPVYGHLRQPSGLRFVANAAESLGAPLTFDRANDHAVGLDHAAADSYEKRTHEDSSSMTGRTIGELDDFLDEEPLCA